jgi:hypothetical protein
MSFIHSIVKINDKSVFDMILDKQTAMTKTKNGDKKNRVPYPDVIEKLLKELVEIKKQK